MDSTICSLGCCLLDCEYYKYRLPVPSGNVHKTVINVSEVFFLSGIKTSGIRSSWNEKRSPMSKLISGDNELFDYCPDTIDTVSIIGKPLFTYMTRWSMTQYSHTHLPTYNDGDDFLYRNPPIHLSGTYIFNVMYFGDIARITVIRH